MAAALICITVERIICIIARCCFLFCVLTAGFLIIFLRFVSSCQSTCFGAVLGPVRPTQKQMNDGSPKRSQEKNKTKQKEAQL